MRIGVFLPENHQNQADAKELICLTKVNWFCWFCSDKLNKSSLYVIIKQCCDMRYLLCTHLDWLPSAVFAHFRCSALWNIWHKALQVPLVETDNLDTFIYQQKVVCIKVRKYAFDCLGNLWSALYWWGLSNSKTLFWACFGIFWKQASYLFEDMLHQWFQPGDRLPFSRRHESF